MSTGRPSRGARVVYKEVESDEDDFESEAAFDDFAEEKIYQSVFPPLTPLQLELRQLCRSGNKTMLKTFLANNPEIDLDVKDPEGMFAYETYWFVLHFCIAAGTTALNEVATKSAQFAEIVELLIEAGAGLEITDGLGNTPLHNAVLYYPSTQETVDLLLEKGANVSAMNYEGSTPLLMADDKDLKTVLRQLKKASERKNPVGVGAGYMGSPDLRKMVFDKKLTEEINNKSIIVKFNSPVTVKSPGLLKRKRESDDIDESFGKKRIRFSEQDSTGADIDPQFSDDEDTEDISSELSKDVIDQSQDDKDSGGVKNSEKDIISADTGSNNDIIETGSKSVSLPLLADSQVSHSVEQSAAVAVSPSSSSANVSTVVTDLSLTGQKGKQSSITSFFLPRQTQEISYDNAHNEKSESSAINDDIKETDLPGENISSLKTTVDRQEVSLAAESESLTDACSQIDSAPCAQDDSLLPERNHETDIS